MQEADHRSAQLFKRQRNEGTQSRIDDIRWGTQGIFIANNDMEEAWRTSNRVPESSDNENYGIPLAKIM